MTAAPDAEALLAQARALAGLTVGELAAALGTPPPARLGERKGWTGELLERALGASAGAEAAPDFPDLGVELKTIPLLPGGRPAESTWVTRVPLDPRRLAAPFAQSALGAKLACVLWVPVEARRADDRDRRIGRALLWRPDAAERALLERDHEDLAALILAGRVDEITARLGEVLQIRPKGRDGRSRARALGEDGHPTWTSTRGYYLRATFTRRVLARLARGAEHFPPGAPSASLSP
jgi:DNA mismatch repair protein MutH